MTTDTRQEPGFSSAPVRNAPRRERRASITPWLMAIAGVLLAGAILYGLFRPIGALRWSLPTAQPQPPAAAAPAPAAPPVLDPAPAADALQAAGIEPAVVDLLGREALRFLQFTDFPRRFAATVDNLGREQAPVIVWPVRPTAGRFTVEPGAQGAAIAGANAQRYAPFVAFATSVDAGRAVDLYQRMYPVLQQAYRELGFGNRSLHQRVLDVIDLLLATPQPAQPPRVTLVEVKGPVPSSRPWTRYEFTDPALQRLAAGQKILLRVGPEHRRALEAKLRELREQLLRVSVPRR